jgi:flagellar hook assembly protein FlgD
MNVFPNPATDKASVSFSLSATTEASVTVIDGVGRTVAVINNGKLNAGNHTFDIDTKNLTSGIYSVVVNADGGTFTQRLSVVK